MASYLNIDSVTAAVDSWPDWDSVGEIIDLSGAAAGSGIASGQITTAIRLAGAATARGVGSATISGDLPLFDVKIYLKKLGDSRANAEFLAETLLEV